MDKIHKVKPSATTLTITRKVQNLGTLNALERGTKILALKISIKGIYIYVGSIYWTYRLLNNQAILIPKTCIRYSLPQCFSSLYNYLPQESLSFNNFNLISWSDTMEISGCPEQSCPEIGY